MLMPLSEFGFKEVFGFRPPTPEESEEIADAMSIKYQNDGNPKASGAFFDVEGLGEMGMEYMQDLARQYAKVYEISEDEAIKMIYAGFIGALEMISTIQLKVND